jgi:hypothetical protein
VVQEVRVERGYCWTGVYSKMVSKSVGMIRISGPTLSDSDVKNMAPLPTSKVPFFFFFFLSIS